MSNRLQELRRVPNSELVRGLAELIGRARVHTADAIAHIAEMERRRLHLAAGFSSMHDYCVARLHLSEHEAFTRLRAARAARRYPQVLDLLADGRLHLTAIVCLHRHLLRGHGELLEVCVYKTRAEIEKLLAERFPRQDVPAQVVPVTAPIAPAPNLPMSGNCSKLAPALVESSLVATEQPTLATPSTPASEALAPPDRVTPLAPQRHALQVTISQSTRDKLRYAQELLSHQVPNGDLAEVLDRALDALIVKLEKQKFAATTRPKPARAAAAGSRHVPAAVKRAVHERDDGRCTFVGEGGHRCESRKFLEYDHVTEFSRGGRATVSNLRLRCRAHNQYEAERTFGAAFMSERRDGTPRSRAASP